MSLDSLLIQPGQWPWPTAEKQNALLAHLLRNRFLSAVDRLRKPPGFPHPWDVSVSRIEERPGLTLPPERTWRVDIRPGTMNDVLPTMLYRRRDDPRGWTLPDDFAAPVVGDKDYDPVWIERDLLDDADDPPFLTVRQPGEKDEPHDMLKVPDAQRPEAFMDEISWDLELWQSHVLLSASPIAVAGVQSAAFPPPRLGRYRHYVSPRLPSPTFGARTGGWVELATLYLLRDPKEPELAEMFVRQREFWPLWAAIVQPGADLPELIRAQPMDLVTGLPLADFAIATGNALNQIFADLALAQLESSLESATSLELWTV